MSEVEARGSEESRVIYADENGERRVIRGVVSVEGTFVVVESHSETIEIPQARVLKIIRPLGGGDPGEVA